MSGPAAAAQTKDIKISKYTKYEEMSHMAEIWGHKNSGVSKPAYFAMTIIIW